MRVIPSAIAAFLFATNASASTPNLTSSYRFVSPDKSASPVALASGSGEEAIIYLNRDGGLYLPGSNDSRLNTSSLIDGPSIVFPYTASSSQWNDVVSCVEDQFEGFRVRITDDDPGIVPHYEAVVAGRPADIGQDDTIGGLSPFRLDCGAIDNSVVFVFAELFGDQTDRLCEVIAQEVAHSFGLDHQMNCDDPMSYLGDCGAKRFRNEEAQCGEFEARECACGQETQNSRKTLARYLGDRIDPIVDVPSPADGMVVNPVFYVDVRAEDNIAIERVELYADGQKVASQAVRPFLFEFHGELGDGHHDLEIRVFDSENTVSTALSVDVDPEAEMQPPPPVQALNNRASPASDVQGGCATAGRAPRGSAGVLLLGLFALVGTRRRFRR